MSLAGLGDPALAAPDDGAVAPRRLGDLMRDLVGYGLVSVVALACDYGLLVGLAAAGLHYLVAATIGFCTGMAVAYALSARFVFADRRDGSRTREAAGFAIVGLAGLCLTQAALWLLVGRLHLPPALAKVPTAGGVFLFNFLARRSLVFVGRGTVSSNVAEPDDGHHEQGGEKKIEGSIFHARAISFPLRNGDGYAPWGCKSFRFGSFVG